MRVKRGVRIHARHKKVLKQTKGYFGRSKNCYSIAVNRLKRGLEHAYAHRKDKKGDMRRLWIIRISAACRNLGFKYSQFMHQLKVSNVTLNRKMLSEIALNNQEAFANFAQKIMAQNA